MRENILMHTGSGRVDDDHLRPKAQRLQVLADIPKKKFTVFDSVSLTVPAGIDNGGLHDFHADHSPRGPSEKNGDRADAAVKIQDGLPANKFCKLGYLPVEFFGPKGIGLEEGVGGDMKQGGTDPVQEGSVSCKDRFPFPNCYGSL